MLSKTHRKRCRKLQHEFFDSGRVQVHHVTSEENFDQGFDILLQLHAARWSEAGKPLGGFSDRRFREFHKTVARELLNRKQLLLVWLEYKGKPVAVEYQFIGQKTVYSYQAGMDPAVVEFSPGNLSVMASIQYAIAQGCDSFDLSRGDQPYKSNWRATPDGLPRYTHLAEPVRRPPGAQSSGACVTRQCTRGSLPDGGLKLGSRPASSMPGCECFTSRGASADFPVGTGNNTSVQ